MPEGGTLLPRVAGGDRSGSRPEACNARRRNALRWVPGWLVARPCERFVNTPQILPRGAGPCQRPAFLFGLPGGDPGNSGTPALALDGCDGPLDYSATWRADHPQKAPRAIPCSSRATCGAFLRRYSDIALAGVVVLIVGMMIVPLPTIDPGSADRREHVGGGHPAAGRDLRQRRAEDRHASPPCCCSPRCSGWRWRSRPPGSSCSRPTPATSSTPSATSWSPATWWWARSSSSS